MASFKLSAPHFASSGLASSAAVFENAVECVALSCQDLCAVILSNKRVSFRFAKGFRVASSSVNWGVSNMAINKSLASLAPTKVLRRCASQNFGGLLPR